MAASSDQWEMQGAWDGKASPFGLRPDSVFPTDQTLQLRIRVEPGSWKQNLREKQVLLNVTPQRASLALSGIPATAFPMWPCP